MQSSKLRRVRSIQDQIQKVSVTPACQSLMISLKLTPDLTTWNSLWTGSLSISGLPSRMYQMLQDPSNLLLHSGFFAHLEICSWVNNSLGVSRPTRSPQLWIVGPGGCGKSSFFTHLALAYRLEYYDFPYGETFHDHWLDYGYHFALIDEFQGQVTIGDINRFVDGQRTRLKVKSHGSVLKTQNIPCIVVSNKTPEECYPNCSQSTSPSYSQFLAMKSRFKVVHVPNNYYLNFYFHDALDVPYPARDFCVYRSYHLLDSDNRPIIFSEPQLEALLSPPSSSLPPPPGSPPPPLSSSILSPISPSSSLESTDVLSETSPSSPFWDTACPYCEYIHPECTSCPSTPRHEDPLEEIRQHYEPMRRRLEALPCTSIPRAKYLRVSGGLSSLFDDAASESDYSSEGSPDCEDPSFYSE